LNIDPAMRGIEYFESRYERDELDAEIAQISAEFERGRFAKVSTIFSWGEACLYRVAMRVKDYQTLCT